jgi:cytochrome c oxidase subunit 2
MEQILGLPPVASAHGAEIDHSIVIIHYLMLALFLGWSLFYVMLLVRFRKSKNPHASYTGNKSKFAIYLAAIVGVFELGMLYAVDAPVWARRVSNLPDEKDAVVVRVVAEQFAWNVHYPGKDGKFGKRSISLVDGENPLGLDRSDADAKDDITTINQLYLPVGKPVIIYLTSKDVIHSFNLPLFRVKQDAIPGITVPVWFVPTKTTAAIREEVARPYSVAEAMKKVRMMPVPQVQSTTLSRGMSMDEQMVMQDYADAQGTGILSKGDKLTAENVQKLVDGGVTQVKSRQSTAMDKYLTHQEMKDQGGTTVLGRNETLTDDAVTKLAEAGIKEVAVRPLANMDTYIVMQAYNDKSGATIANKGDMITDEMLSKFSDAGIDNIVISPATPTEIACAQLCGLGHYRMRGYVTIVTPEEYEKWINEQEAGLAPPPAADSTQHAPGDSVAVASNAGSAH